MKQISKFLCVALIAALSLTMLASCGKKEVKEEQTTTEKVETQEDNTSTSNSVTPSSYATLEDYINSDSNVKQQVESTANNSNMTIEVKGNTLIYTYDVANMNVDKDTALSSEMKTNLESSLDQMSSTFSSLCKQLESATKLDGVSIVVKYVHGSDVISEREFTAE